VEKKTYSLCFEVLKRFQKQGLLEKIILVGSWSIYFYKNYFNSKSYTTYIRTKDLDFLIPLPSKLNHKVDIAKLIEDLGFIEVYMGSKGYIKLEHPDLAIEFLVPERGRGTDTPYNIPALGINAQPLRYLDFLVAHTIKVNAEGLHITLPHPAAYALHKFIIFKRRRNIDKRDKDLEGAIRVFSELMQTNKQGKIIQIFKTMHKKWQSTIIKNLALSGESEIIELLK